MTRVRHSVGGQHQRRGCADAGTTMVILCSCDQPIGSHNLRASFCRMRPWRPTGPPARCEGPLLMLASWLQACPVLVPAAKGHCEWEWPAAPARTHHASGLTLLIVALARRPALQWQCGATPKTIGPNATVPHLLAGLHTQLHTVAMAHRHPHPNSQPPSPRVPPCPNPVLQLPRHEAVLRSGAVISGGAGAVGRHAGVLCGSGGPGGSWELGAGVGHVAMPSGLLQPQGWAGRLLDHTAGSYWHRALFTDLQEPGRRASRNSRAPKACTFYCSLVSMTMCHRLLGHACSFRFPIAPPRCGAPRPWQTF